MAKSDRLLRLLHLLRRLPPPVTAARLAAELEVSERTVYRDIDGLRAGGAGIDGSAGYGYVLAEDPALPPQMFSRLEVEALVAGLAEVRHSGDPALARAAADALAKIVASVPERVQRQAMHAVTQVYKWRRPPRPPAAITLVREACWAEQAVDLVYADAQGRRTERRVWPLSIVLLEDTQLLLAWCCLRQDLRKFLLPRIVDARATDESFRPRRVPLLREFLRRMKDEGRPTGAG